MAVGASRLSLCATSVGATATFTRPASVVDGDLVVMAAVTGTTTTPTVTGMPAGFAASASINRGERVGIVFCYGKAEPGVTSWQVTVDQSIAVWMLLAYPDATSTGAFYGQNTNAFGTPAVTGVFPTVTGGAVVTAHGWSDPQTTFASKSPDPYVHRDGVGNGGKGTSVIAGRMGDELNAPGGDRFIDIAADEWNLGAALILEPASVASTPPATPGAPTATVVDYQTVDVSWNAVADASSYDLRVNGTTIITGVTSPYRYAASANTSYSFEVMALNAAGSSAWSAASNTVTTPNAPQYGRPIAPLNVQGAWTASTGVDPVTQGHTTIDEVTADTTDYLVSPTNPDATTLLGIPLSNLNKPDTDSPVVMRIMADKDAGARTIDLVVDVQEGGTLISSLSLGTLTSDSPTIYEDTLLATEVAAVVDWNNLSVEINPTTAGGGSGSAARIYWVELQVPYGTVVETIVISGSDTLAASVADTTEPLAIHANVAASDSLSASLTESADFATVEVSSSDTLSAQTTDTSSVDINVSAADSLSVSMAEAAVLAVAISATDGVSASLSDTSLAEISISVADSLATSLGESAIVGTIAISSSDTLSTQIADTSTTGVDVEVGDSLAASLTESSSLEVYFGSTDALSVGIAEGSATLGATLSSTDVVSIGISESSEFGQVAVSADDTISAGLTEKAGIDQVPVGSDLVSASFTDIASVEKTGTFEYVASDITATSLTDQGLVEVVVTGSDSVAAGIADAAEATVASGDVAQAASDTIVSSVTESSAISVLVASSDTVVASITEATAASVSFTSNDSLSASLNEVASVLVTDISASDTISPALAETASTTTAGPASDLISPSVTEDAMLEKSGLFEHTAPDALTTGIAEQTSLEVVMSTSDAVTSSVSDVAEPIVVSGVQEIIGSESVAASIDDTSVVVIAISQNDGLNTSVTESSSFAPVEVVGNENLPASLTETVELKVDTSASDSISAGIVDESAIVTSAPGEDIISASITETSSIVTDGYIAVVAADSITTSVSDQSLVEPLLSAADTIVPLVAETAVTFVTLSSSDAISINLSESVAIPFEISASDDITAGIADTASLTTSFVGTVFVTTSDSLTYRVTEVASVSATVYIDKARMWNGTTYVTGTLKPEAGGNLHVPRIYAWNGERWI